MTEVTVRKPRFKEMDTWDKTVFVGRVILGGFIVIVSIIIFIKLVS